MNSITATLPHRQARDPWKMWSATVTRAQKESPHVFTYDLAFDDPAIAEQYQFLPGQFNMLYLPGVGEVAISIAGRKPNSRVLQHTVRAVGAVTNAMESAGPGMSLGLRGPFGTSWPIELMAGGAEKKDIVIAAGGIGLAPLRALIEYLANHRDDYGAVSVLIGARTPEDVLYHRYQEDWQQFEIDVQCTIDRPDARWGGHVGVVTLLLDRLPLPRPDRTLVMTCGPEVMMRYVAKSATARNIPVENIWVTLERNMNCAIGLCGHCQMGPLFLCKDGPVFRYDRVSQWLHIHDL